MQIKNSICSLKVGMKSTFSNSYLECNGALEVRVRQAWTHLCKHVTAEIDMAWKSLKIPLKHDNTYSSCR